MNENKICTKIQACSKKATGDENRKGYTVSNRQKASKLPINQI